MAAHRPPQTEDVGFKVGSEIVRKSDGLYGFKSMSNTEVVVTCGDGLDYKLSVDDLVSGRCTETPKQKELEHVKDKDE